MRGESSRKYGGCDERAPAAATQQPQPCSSSFAADCSQADIMMMSEFSFSFRFSSFGLFIHVSWLVGVVQNVSTFSVDL